MTKAQFANVLALLDEPRLLSFFRAADRVIDRPTSIQILCQGLDRGRSLEDLLCFELDQTIPPRYRLSFELNVEDIETNKYKIHFGAQTSALGDGASWVVTFDTQGQVLELLMEDPWHK
jgi:hypothetical protein